MLCKEITAVYEGCVAQKVALEDVLLSSSVFLRQYHSTSAACLFTHSLITDAL